MDIEAAAQLMGMKPHREVLEVVAVGDGHVVLTHDGQWTLICDDGSMQFHVAVPDETADPDLLYGADPDVEEPPAGVPDGTKDEVLAWVGDDPARAAAALEVERRRDNPRSTLVAALEKVAG